MNSSIKADTLRLWLTFVLLSMALLFHLSSIPVIFSYRLFWYDESAYLYEAKLLVDGLRPYQDYFAAHPPGTITLISAGMKAGIDVFGLRLLYWAAGFLLAWPIAGMAGRFSLLAEKRDRMIVGAMALVFAFSSEIVLESTALLMTDLPAMLLLMCGIAWFAGESKWRSVAVGLFLAASTGFKIQALVVLPGLFLWNWTLLGRRAGTLANLVLGITVTVAAVLIHGGLSLFYPHYFDAVFLFQRGRPRLNLSSRLEFLQTVLVEPPFVLGLIGATIQLGSKNGMIRGLGWFCLVTTLGLTLGGATLGLCYYFWIMPYLAVCAALMVAQVAAVADTLSLRTIFLAVLAISGIQATNLVGRTTRPLRDRKWESKLVDEIRRFPGATILTADPKIGIFTGKSLAVDYYTADGCPLDEAGKGLYHQWVEKMLPKSDVLIVTSRMRRQVGEGNWDEILRSNKPMIFAEEADEKFIKEIKKTQ